jgi:SAM-dependent methyltransferase
VADPIVAAPENPVTAGRRDRYGRSMDETERVRGVFSRRAAEGLDSRYAYWRPENLLVFQERERALLSILRARGLLPLAESRIIDVGCGTGGVLRDFLRYGAAPENLVGVDLVPERVDAAREFAPNMDFRVANAADLPFGNETFDMALCFTVFSSIMDDRTRALVAREILRLLRRGGHVVWYDFWINPVNRDTRAVRLGEVARLFGSRPVEARRVTLAAPLARAVAPRSWIGSEVLSSLPMLRTNWLALVRVG